MAFHKIGDAQPINSIMDSAGQVKMCPKCHKPLKVLAFDEQDQASLVCECALGVDDE